MSDDNQRTVSVRTYLTEPEHRMFCALAEIEGRPKTAMVRVLINEAVEAAIQGGMLEPGPDYLSPREVVTRDESDGEDGEESDGEDPVERYG